MEKEYVKQLDKETTCRHTQTGKNSIKNKNKIIVINQLNQRWLDHVNEEKK